MNFVYKIFTFSPGKMLFRNNEISCLTQFRVETLVKISVYLTPARNSFGIQRIRNFGRFKNCGRARGRIRNGGRAGGRIRN